MPLAGFGRAALRCHTPTQFRALLKSLRTIIPYNRACASWGHPVQSSLRYILNADFPLDLISWYLGTGTQWRSPLYREWLTTNEPFLWSDAAARFKGRIDPEHFRRVVEAGVQHSLLGGVANLEKDYYVLFILDMGTEAAARQSMQMFKDVLPSIVQASQQSYPDNLLSKREIRILERRMLGEIVKQIADEEGITQRTVSAHLTHIKRKLHTNDLINAVVIALRTGMMFPPHRP